LLVIVASGVTILLAKHCFRLARSKIKRSQSFAAISTYVKKKTDPVVYIKRWKPTKVTPIEELVVSDSSELSEFDDIEKRFFEKINLDKTTMLRDSLGDVGIPQPIIELNSRISHYKIDQCQKPYELS